MKKILCILFALLFITVSKAQLMLQTGAQFTAKEGVAIVLDNMDLINMDAAIDFTDSYVYFKGSNTNQLNGAGNWTFKNLVCYKDYGLLKLFAHVQVTNVLQMASGKIDLNGHVITLSPGAVIQNENEATHIIASNGGWLQTTVTLNAPQAQNPGNLGAVITSSQNLGSVTVKRAHSPAETGKITRYYGITPANNTGLNATLRFYYLNAELNSQAEAGLVMYEGGYNNWSMLGWDARDATQNYVTKTGLSSLKQYAVGT